MKRATFSGIRSILCKLLLLALLLGLSGCATEASSATSSPDPVAADAEISEEPELVAAATETQQPDASQSDETEESMIAAPLEQAGDEHPALGGVEVSFDFTRMSTHASNQLAIWVEDADGRLVKTVLVTNFTAARRGYRNRDMALLHWVSAVEPEGMSDGQIDAISSATPSAGNLVYFWDLTDQNGDRVPDGVYTIYLEGTLYWESNVLFSAVIDTQATEPGELPVAMQRSEPENSENENMLNNVRITATA